MLVDALHRKLFRNLAELRGQLVTIALVVACGIAAYVCLRSTWDSLLFSRTTYYERYRFADVFATCKRAPEALRGRLEAIPGVAIAETRVTERVLIPLDDLPEPASGRVVSIPAGRSPALDALFLRSGRLVEPGHNDEVVLLETFAKGHDLTPGSRFPVVFNGQRRQLRVVGTAASPEYIMAMAPGDLTPDPLRFAVLWMDRDALAPAFQMQGAFNDLTLRLQPGASEPAVLEAVDTLLEPYGGLGTVGRSKQLSHFMLSGELSQLEGMASVVPVIFLGVAAFLLNVVLSRLVFLQRSQIAALKALGYRDLTIGLHFLELVSVIVLLGAAGGLGLGIWFGRMMTELYAAFFHFPVLEYRLAPSVVFAAVGISLLAALAGALFTVRAVVRLPPAEAMRPPAPTIYHRTVLERLGLLALLGPAARMVVREIERRPLRLLLSSVGIAMAVAITVIGQFWGDAMDFMIDVQFGGAMREDLTVVFTEPRPARAVRELAHLPGVLRVEGLREVPVRVRSGAGFRDSILIGYPDEPDLRRLLDQYGKPHPLPVSGVVLTDKLAELFDIEPGQSVTLEVREGDRRHLDVLVSGLVGESFGLRVHARAATVAPLLGEEPLVTTALLLVDPATAGATRARLKELPAVASVTRRDNLAERFVEQSRAMIVTFSIILTLFASVIAVGVVYNNARVALSMRSRELASLRVLGFSQAEVGAILLGELAVQVLLAIPAGLAIGTWLAGLMMSTVDPETYRFPVVVSARSYAFAVVVALVSGVISALLVRRRLQSLDLIGVLKTRD
ncbi:MAG: ABC transporter permease [Polyangiaceae bacterium]|nr:ABC transporter permease [Polyangiaceae bacterium]